jgi:hypothetical protein
MLPPLTLRDFNLLNWTECTIQNATKTIKYYGTKMKSEAQPHSCYRIYLTPPPHNTQPSHSRSLLLLGRCSSQLRKTVQVITWFIQGQNVSSLSNITSHRNRLLLFVKYLAMRILTRKHRILTPTGKISGHRKCLSHRARNQQKLRPYRFQTVYQLQQRDKDARIQYCHWFRRCVREGIHV